MAASAVPRLTVRFVLINAIMLLAATGVAMATMWTVYQSAAFLVAVTVSALVGCLIGVSGAVLRWSSLVVLLVAVAAFLVIGVPLGVPSQAYFGVLPSWQGMIDLLAGTALSWKQLLTIVTPVGSYQALLVPVVLSVLAATTVGMSVALRARRGEFAVLAPLALFVLAIVLGPTTAVAPVETALLLGIVLVFWAAWVHRRRRAEAIALVAQRGSGLRESATRRRLAATRTVLSSAVIVAVAVAGGTVAAVAYPAAGAREVPRRHTEQPFDPRDYPSPLAGFRRYLEGDAASTTMLTVSGLPTGGLIRIAAHDSYDGIVYSVGSDTVTSASGSFTRLPFRIDQSAVEGDDVSIDVTVGGYRGVWVPGVGKLESIRFTSDRAGSLTDSFYYNDNAATGAVLGGLEDGDEYRADAVVPPAPSDITKLRPGTAVLPPFPEDIDGISTLLADWIDETADPGTQLAQMIEGMRRDGYVSHGLDGEPPSRSGHSADRLTQLATELPMLGDGEQYAATAAVMARMIGFPARAVIGFAPSITSTTGSVAVTGDDVAAWIEVQDSTGAWVSLDPNPDPRDVPPQKEEEPIPVSRPQVVLPPPLEEPQLSEPAPDPQSAPTDVEPPVDPTLALVLLIGRIGAWTALALALLLSPFLAIVAAKVRRRRYRRRTGSTVDRIAGGWREFADLAVDHGYPLSPAATRAENAAVVGGGRPLLLARDVDRAVFAPGTPPSADADHVWREVDELRGTLDAGRSRWQRLRARISLRSFRLPGEGRRQDQ
ncbi:MULTISPECIES: transglutaminaseTgpA domain-containing protein [unclassified Leifsonia]|uniref:transglutaminaseTgpA domain-containing protein n=1 Tax=unclassified Leifsonia TaxID=2663824 RepID=UPI000A86B65C|nr:MULTISPECIES: transglutaminaseTgpA domain-containing protein [unclassified Leifsonia]